MQARRAFLRRAATAGTLAWAAPTILTMNAGSAAAMTSPPPGDIASRNDATAPRAIADQAAARAGQLPRTGADIDKLTAAGLTAAAGGGALLWWSSALDNQAATESAGEATD
jgi:LPXTG-motif cell wall-anchored protein